MQPAQEPASAEAPPAQPAQEPPPVAAPPAPPGQDFAERVSCPKCGGADTAWVVELGQMRCQDCRSTFVLDASGVASLVNDDVANLRGSEFSVGASQDVAESEDQVMTLRCPSCGAEMVVQAANLAGVKCHWCRNQLSPANRIPNGARPDGIVPFTVTREQAKASMQEFLKKRRAFANRKFLAQYTLENIQPVYFPYFMVDLNAKADHRGLGAHLVRKHTKKQGDSSTTYYDYDIYSFERRFDLLVNDLLVPSNAEFANQDARLNTHNIINSVAPWDTHATVPYDPHYLQGEFRAERRTSNVSEVRGLVGGQLVDISHVQANKTMPYYDHGVMYQHDDVQVQGERWVTLLCPVWVYSYLEVRSKGPMLHYIAVNGTNGKTIGSVPTSKARMLVVAGVAQVVGMVAGVIWLILGG